MGSCVDEKGFAGGGDGLGTRPPNVLFIVSDQHNPFFLGRAAHPVAQTPRLDALAARSADFTAAYCQNPLCVPSRASLLTGRWSRSLGIYENRDVLDPDLPTLPRHFARHGWHTALIGKAHFNGEQFQGYQERPFGDIYGQAHQPDTETGDASRLGHMVGNAGATSIPEPLTQTEICVAESVKWLQTHRALHAGQPFLLSLHFDKPHFPVRCPERFLSPFRGRLRALGSAGDGSAVGFVRAARERFLDVTPEMGAGYLEAYCGCIAWIDDAIGRVLEALAFLGLADDTIVIYASDHGDLCGRQGIWNKSLFFEESARVPLSISWPRHIAPLTIRHPVGLIDLFPTLCDLAGLPAPDACEGVSLRPLLEGSAGIGRPGVFCESAMLGQPEVLAGCMLREGRWKYALYLNGEEELYDLETDLAETRNRAVQNPPVEDLTRLRREVQEFWNQDGHRDRIRRQAKSLRHKHEYPHANQFVIGSAIADAFP